MYLFPFEAIILCSISTGTDVVMYRFAAISQGGRRLSGQPSFTKTSISHSQYRH